MMTPKGIKWVGHLACMYARRFAYGILVVKPERG
jgi:hypothetical protein